MVVHAQPVGILAQLLGSCGEAAEREATLQALHTCIGAWLVPAWYPASAPETSGIVQCAAEEMKLSATACLPQQPIPARGYLPTFAPGRLMTWRPDYGLRCSVRLASL